MRHRIFLSVMVIIILVRYLLMPLFELHSNIFLLVEAIPFVLSAILLHRAAAAHGKPYSRFWHMLGWGSTLFAAANLTWIAYDLLLDIEAPIPSISDILWSLQNFSYVGALVYLLMRGRSSYRSIRFLFDTIIVLIIVGAASWEFVIRPRMDYFLDTTGFWGVLVTTTYPITDLAMLISVFMLYASNRFPYAKDVFFCIAAGMIVFIAADTMYLSQVVSGNYEIGNWLDPLFSATVLLFAIAGVRSIRIEALAPPPLQEKTIAPKLKYILPYGGLVILLALALRRTDLQTLDIFVVASILTILLLVVRQVIVLLENDTLMFKLQQALKQAEYLALYDPLSDLPNRRYFEMQAAQILDNVGKDHSVALFFMDLDRFKFINDTYGHDAGDALIREVGARIKSMTDDRHFVSRMGGDEFTILCKSARAEQELLQWARRLIEEIERPFASGALQFNSGASIGISVFPRDGTSAAELLKHADIALYHAKKLGRGQAVIYTDNFGSASSEN